MNDTEINDVRTIQNFKGISFSGYKKTKVKGELLNCIINAKVESACHWTAELICSGHYQDIWDIILLYIGKCIHLGNPKLPIYIDMRFNDFKTIVSNGYVLDELRMRNNDKIRNIFAEIICVLCFSRKKHTFESIKIKKIEEFDITRMTNRLRAPTVTYASVVFKKEDPKELFIAINELAYHISKESKNMVSACYWLEWLIEFEVICKKRKDKCLCERRSFAPVLDKYQTDIIWIVWDLLLYEANKSGKELLNKIISSVLNIFSIRYTSGVKKRRKFLLYFAISLITEVVNYNTDIIQNKESVKLIMSKISLVYKEIKKNEHTPQTDYLFYNTKKNNLEKTVEKLETINNMANIIPRNNTKI